MRPLLAALALVAALVAAAGCGADAKTATSGSTLAPTPTVKIEDFASVVAKNHGRWDKQVDTVEGHCLDPATTAACGAGYITLMYQAETLRLELSGAHKPGVPAYIGSPPTEIADLLAETEDTAGKVKLAYENWEKAGCLEDPFGSDLKCTAELTELQGAISRLSDQLDAWAPYGGGP